MQLGMTWNESRLIRTTLVNSSSMVSIDKRFAQNLWFPDIYVYDMKKAHVSNFNFDFAGELCADHLKGLFK